MSEQSNSIITTLMAVQIHWIVGQTRCFGVQNSTFVTFKKKFCKRKVWALRVAVGGLAAAKEALNRP